MSELNPQSRPVIRVTISPKADSDRLRLERALNNLAQQDSTIKIETKSEGGSAIVSGVSESHLESICSRILHEYGIEIEVGEPTVIYLETIRGSSEAEGKYIRQTGGHGNYAHAKIRISPNEPGNGYEFTNDTKGGAIPEEYIRPIDQGIQDAMLRGVRAYEMVDIKVSLYDGSYHDVDSNEMAFRIAGSMAFKEAARKAKPVLLEPVMAIEITVPEDYLGAIISDLNSRRGRIEGMDKAGSSQTINATVPLSTMLGYGAHLRRISQGRADCRMQFVRYEDTPREGQFGDDGPGVAVKRPKRPNLGSGSAAVKLDPWWE
jgi:elongation factor G